MWIRNGPARERARKTGQAQEHHEPTEFAEIERIRFRWWTGKGSPTALRRAFPSLKDHVYLRSRQNEGLRSRICLCVLKRRPGFAGYQRYPHLGGPVPVQASVGDVRQLATCVAKNSGSLPLTGASCVSLSTSCELRAVPAPGHESKVGGFAL